MALCFHILYTPNTVQPLLFLVNSLLTWSDCEFRLVANGCSPQEVQQLAAFCQREPRLHFLQLPSTRMIGHGQALNTLQALSRHKSDYFCFMDSDIYAVGNFLTEFLPHLKGYGRSAGGLFSGAPLEQPTEGWVMPDGYPMLDGRFNRTKDGLCLGSTYFAIYDNQAVDRVRGTSGIGFEGYHWAKLPLPLQEQLTAQGWVYPRYDTARILNLLLHLHGETLLYQPSNHLRHLGGLSRLTHVQKLAWPKRLKIYVSQLLKGQRLRVSDQTFTPIELYFTAFLTALHQQRPLPPVPLLDNKALVARLQAAAQEVASLYQEGNAR